MRCPWLLANWVNQFFSSLFLCIIIKTLEGVVINNNTPPHKKAYFEQKIGKSGQLLWLESCIQLLRCWGRMRLAKVQRSRKQAGAGLCQAQVQLG